SATVFGRHNYTIFQFLLPFIEQDNIYNLLTPTGYAGGQYFRVIPTFLCPSDDSSPNGKSSTPYGGAVNWGISNYGANNWAFGDPSKGGLSGEGSILQTFTDGAPNRVMFAEMYGPCGSSGTVRVPGGSLWADPNSIWRPGYNLGLSKNQVSGSPPAR